MENWDEQAAPVVAELPEIKVFGKWSTDDVQVSDISLTVSTTSETLNRKAFSNEPRHEKMCRPDPIQTGLYNHKKWLEGYFRFRK